MTSPSELDTFVRDSLSRGQGRDQTRRVLKEAGWKDDEVTSALEAFADIEFPVPVPRPRPYFSARETFVYMVVFVLLYVWAFQLGLLQFLLIERALPDAALDVMGRSDYARAASRFGCGLG